MRGRRPRLSERGQQVALLIAKGYDRQEVAEELDVSLRTAGNYITRVLDYMQMRASRRDANAETLTARQAQVANMAAEGKSNRQIADELGLGERTVESHVASALRKRGVSSRYELLTLQRPHRVRRTRQHRSAPPKQVAKRQAEVWALLADGHSNAEIADALGIGERSVETAVRALRRKLGAQSRVELATKFVRWESAGKPVVIDQE